MGRYMKKGDLVICFNKHIGFKSVGYIEEVLSTGNLIIYTFRSEGFGIWQESYIKLLTKSGNVLVDNMEKKT